MANTVEQIAIYDAIKGTDDNIAVDALAGTGKTHTAVDSAKEASGSVQFTAFNRHISEELNHRLGGAGTASTLHAIGCRLVQSSGRRQVVQDKYRDIIARQNPRLVDGRTKRLKDEYAPVFAVVEAWRNQLIPLDPSQQDLQNLGDALASMGWEAPENPEAHQMMFPIAKAAVGEGIHCKRTMDFTDMITMPHYLNLTRYQSDLIIADEAQDFNPAQQQLITRLAPRVMHVGDPRQAIMGFAGADTNSFHNMTDRLGSVSLPLTVCWRCPSSHLDLARILVPTIQDRPNAPAGSVIGCGPEGLANTLEEGDMVICRTNAPLLGMAYRLIASGRSAKIRGRDIGAGLYNLIKRLKPTHLNDLAGKLAKYRQNQAELLSAKDATEAVMQKHTDQCDCLSVMIDNVESLDGLHHSLDAMFGDTVDESKQVVLSSIHRAKGSQASRVALLCPDKLGRFGRTSQACIQEVNLAYIAITRSTKDLIIVGDHGCDSNEEWLGKMANLAASCGV